MTPQEIDEKYYYDGDDLGAHFTKMETTFTLWAPTAYKVEVIEYKLANTPQLDGIVHQMNKVGGVHIFKYEGNHDGMIYTYRVYFENGRHKETRDPYAFGATVNGNRSVVVDFAKTRKVAPFENRVDVGTKANVMEMHVRDVSINHPEVPTELRGKFLGAGHPAIVNYIKNLGINYVQIQPFYDFATVDELQNSTKYNWGYDPQNYNVPEGSYSKNPSDPYSRIEDLKEMISEYHKNDIGVIMDVVYNHVYLVDQDALEATVPGYYFRKNPDGSMSNGTGINNDTASERKMFAKYMKDSMLYWAREFGIDGFRFDLMGIHDIHTLQNIRDGLNQIDTKIITYGEGWSLNTALAPELLATQKNADKLPEYGFFNDEIRNGIKGDGDSNIGGFVSDVGGQEEYIVNGIMGRADNGSYLTPSQLVNYAEAHDNLNLNDKLLLSNPSDSERVHFLRDTLATALVYLTRGIPFIEIGQEFLRTKLGHPNSYNAGDTFNAVDWTLAEKNVDVVNLVRALIKFRKQTSLVSNSRAEINENTEILVAKNGLIVFKLDNKYLIGLNTSGVDVDLGQYAPINELMLSNNDSKELADLSFQIWTLV
ncbi:MAG: type I pullulanase [Lactobacillaceae bacterium]|jgi:pullulanase|nr:type I pullulanase [Lactobacillaceae bacterium]